MLILCSLWFRYLFLFHCKSVVLCVLDTRPLPDVRLVEKFLSSCLCLVSRPWWSPLKQKFLILPKSLIVVVAVLNCQCDYITGNICEGFFLGWIIWGRKVSLYLVFLPRMIQPRKISHAPYIKSTEERSLCFLPAHPRSHWPVFTAWSWGFPHQY